MVSDDRILEEFKKIEDIYRVCENLVDEANYRGGKDNISIVAVKFNDEVKA